MESKFKVGDKVRCLPKFTQNEKSGGYGYKKDYEIIIERITTYGDKLIYWPGYNNNGVYECALELVPNSLNYEVY